MYLIEKVSGTGTIPKRKNPKEFSKILGCFALWLSSVDRIRINQIVDRISQIIQ